MNLNEISEYFDRLQITVAKRAELYALLSSLIGDGIPVNNAFSSIDAQFQKEKDPRRLITSVVMARLRGDGGVLSLSIGQSLKGLIPDMEAITIESGEAGGDLAEGFRRAAEIAENSSEIRGVILGALVYPVILFAMVGLLMWMMSEKFVPSMKRVSPYEAWPASAKALSWLSDHAGLIYSGLLLVVFGWLAIFMLSRERWVGPKRDFFDSHIFPWTMNRKVNAATILASLASLMRMGIPLKSALDRMDRASNPWVKYHFDKIRNRLRDGQKEGASIAPDLYDSGEQWQIILYGGLLDFSSAMEKVSKKMMKSLVGSVQSTFDLIRYLMMFGVGLMIIWIYGSFTSVVMAGRLTGGN